MRQNVKRTIAFAETVAMIATLTVGITFGNATQVKADITSRTNNIHIDTSIPISSQGETVGYEFTVEKDGYYMLYTQGEDDTYGTLYVKEGTTWKELIHDDDGDDGDSNNFLLTATLYKDKEYKIDVREYDNNNFSTELFATEYTPIINGVNCSSNVYARVGDTVELKTYAEDQYGNHIEDLGDLGITYRWYMEDDETSKIDELGTGSSYTVNNVTEHIFNEVTYKVDWRYGEYNDTLEFYIYDTEYSYKINSDNSGNIYASQGESVSLNIKVENYKKEEVDPDEEGITCTWYKCNDDERKEIGKGKSYTIDSVEQNDFYDEDSNIRYRCIIKKNDKFIDATTFYIYDRVYAYETQSIWIRTMAGQSCILEANVANAETYNEVNPANEGITVKWYKYTGKRYYDSGNDDYYYEYGDPVEVSSDGFILLNNLSEKDFYRNGDTSTYWTYAIYKNGKKIDESDAHISKEDADFSGVTEMKVVYANEGSSATLVPDVYENGTKVSLNKNYICEWSNEKDENLGTKLVYDISNVTATNIYSYQNPVSYYCDVYKVSYDGDGEYRERIGYTRFIIVRGNSQINQPNQPNQSGQPTTLPGQNNVTTPTTNNTVGNAAKDTTIKETVKGNVLKAGKGSIKISIKKIAKAKGYQVQVSTSKKFKKKVTITKLTKKNSIVIKKLKKKKQYFVRTRSYTIVKKKKKFGKWSKIKAIKTK